MFRASLIAALMLWLAACCPQGARAPFAESRLPPSLSARFFPPEGWAWGYVGVGDGPVQRYGVASTHRVPTAIVVIVPGYGETAETWFETASDLIDQGCTVWILDRAGQGGSGRYASPRDLGFVPTFEREVSALRELVRVVIKPPRDARLVLLSHADGAVVALAALRSGLRADALVAGSPTLAQPPPARLLGAVRKPDAKPAGWRAWDRDTPDDHAAKRTHDPYRGAVTKAWMTANPDLRLTGPAVGWTKAYQVASRTLEAGGAQLRTPVLMIAPEARAAALCRQAPECRIEALPGARAALHLEADRWRAPWFKSVLDVVKAAPPRTLTDKNSTRNSKN